MDRAILIKAKKDGTMDSGRIFCYKDAIYDGVILDEGSAEEFYYVFDESDEQHGMDKDFFDQYFILFSLQTVGNFGRW